MNDLKPCPHCGGRAVMVEGKRPENIGKYSATCGQCFCATTWRTSKEDAEFDWNRRAEPENKPLTLEQLRQMDGETVWIPETEAYFSGHGIVNVKEEKVYVSDEENDYYPFDEYGAWLAYAREPVSE